LGVTADDWAAEAQKARSALRKANAKVLAGRAPRDAPESVFRDLGPDTTEPVDASDDAVQEHVDDRYGDDADALPSDEQEREQAELVEEPIEELVEKKAIAGGKPCRCTTRDECPWLMTPAYCSRHVLIDRMRPPVVPRTGGRVTFMEQEQLERELAQLPDGRDWTERRLRQDLADGVAEVRRDDDQRYWYDLEAYRGDRHRDECITGRTPGPPAEPAPSAEPHTIRGSSATARARYKFRGQTSATARSGTWVCEPVPPLEPAGEVWVGEAVPRLELAGDALGFGPPPRIGESRASPYFGYERGKAGRPRKADSLSPAERQRRRRARLRRSTP
jgi:hypothetical protein